MRWFPMRLALSATVMLAWAAGPDASLSQAAPSAPPGSGPYTSAKECSSCHQTIYTYWSESAHSRSASSPPYLEGLKGAVAGAADQEEVRRECIWCHAPTALATGDYDLKQPVTREGIICDFCHTVAGVDMDQADHPFDLKPGKVKRGPLEYARSPYHETEYSPLHRTSSLLCASCHEYENELGVLVLSTYTEWKESPYPSRGVPCQECHMPLVPGNTVREGIESSTQRRINLHRLVGGSGASQLRRGLDLRIDSLIHAAGSADVRVVVSNTAVGHAVPGGLSSKTLVLAVGVETASGELLHRRERVYRRDLNDAQGRVLSAVADLFRKAAAVGQDTRIKPKESRSERFTVPVPEGAKAIVARLEYRDDSDPKAGPRTTLIYEERRELAPH
jgi:hypothetical protein